MKRRRCRILKLLLLIFNTVLLLVIGFFIYLQVRPLIVEDVTIEAGAVKPDVKEFLLYKNSDAAYVTNLAALTDPGSYEIKIKVGGKSCRSMLHIVDTTAPSATVTDQMLLKGEDIQPSDFLSDIKDASDVVVSYVNVPDTSKAGEQPVHIMLEDSSKNRTELTAKLMVLDIKKTVTIEAGSVMDITTKDFVDNDQYHISFLTDLSKLDISKVTVHKILLNVNGKEVAAEIKVVDTTAPKAVFADREIWKGDSPEAISFVPFVQDASKVTVSYEGTPDFTAQGDTCITILVKDEYQNVTKGTAHCMVKEDTEPPQINGARDKTVCIGEAVAYRKGISVTDNRDENLTLNIDSSAVNLKQEGTYPVIYTAKDKAGNTAKVKITVTVERFTVTQEMADSEADKILTKIVTKDMTKQKKCRQIYKWIRSHVSYTGHSDKTNWLAEAHRGMTKGKGDCFTFYAVAQELLTRAGIDNMCVTRVGGRTKHYWNLINYGTGWYHFDSCPNRDHRETFLMTDKEVEELTKIRGNNYYIFDKTLYPATNEK